MKLALFNDHRPGLVRGDRIVDISDVAGDAIMGLAPTQRMQAILERFAEMRGALARLDGGVPLTEVRLRAPLPRPGKILCAIGNYSEGVRGVVLPLVLWLAGSMRVARMASELAA